MRRVLRALALCALCVAEPCMHALGLPHVEGMSAWAMNVASQYRGE